MTNPATKPNLLMSACLLGEPVRYDGAAKGLAAEQLALLRTLVNIIPVCPEVAGGLPTPRPPAELQGGEGADVWGQQARVMTQSGEDVTARFVAGAKEALALAELHQCRYALLMARSPSCGNSQIYDGSFSGQLRAGGGVTSVLLQQQGIQVFNPQEWSQLLACLQQAIVTPEIPGQH